MVPFVDKDGNPIEEKDGKFYNSKGDVLKTNNPKKDAGPIERGIEKSRTKMESLRRSSGKDKSIKTSHNNKTPDYNGGTNDMVQNDTNNKVHNDSFNKDNSIITKWSEKLEPWGI